MNLFRRQQLLLNSSRSAWVVLCLGAILSLSACGGGGGGGSPAPAAPAPAPSPVNSAPGFTSDAMISVYENSTAAQYIATASDKEGDKVTFSLTGGADQALFSIDADSGVVSFLAVPDFEEPVDSNVDNVYLIEITANDGSNSVKQTVIVTVMDQLEGVNVSAVDIKTVQFDWPAFSGATFYRLLVNPDGISGYSPIKDNILTVSTTVTLPVHLTDWINASYILEAHDSSGMISNSPAITISSLMLSSMGYFKASNPGFFDTFGLSVALSADGNTMAMGSPGESSSATGVNGDQTNENINSAGAVYLFRRDNNSGVWTQEAYIKPDNPGLFLLFGSVVALSDDGNTLAVSAPTEDSNATGINGSQLNDPATTNSGAVYLFRFDVVWSQQAYIKASNTDAFDNFGSSLDLSGDGNTLAVGADGESSLAINIDGIQTDNSAPSAGAVYLFRFDSGGMTWSQQAYIKASNTGANDMFGASIALSNDGNTIAVGAVGESSESTGINGNQLLYQAPGAGAAYILRFDPINMVWSHQAYIKASNTDSSDSFGNAIALSSDGNTLAVAAKDENSGSAGVGGDQLDNTITSAGVVYLYRFDTNDRSWSQQAYVKASNPGEFYWFGDSVSLSADGNILVVGAGGEDSNATGINGNPFDISAPSSGAAYLYRFDTSNMVWSQQSYIKASNTEMLDGFGLPVVLSADGNTLAVGAPGESSSAAGINGDQTDNFSAASGAVYLY